MKGLLLSVLFSVFAFISYGQSSSRQVFICPGDTLHFRAESQNAAYYTWYKDDLVVKVSRGDTLTVTEAGSYTVMTDSKSGCGSDLSEAIEVIMRSPQAIKDSASVMIGKSVGIDVLHNDIANCAAFNKNTVRITQYPEKGNITISDSGTVEYTPRDKSGTDAFEYDVLDESGVRTNTAAVMIQIGTGCGEVYPNPAVSDMYVSVQDPAINGIRMADMSGQVLFTMSIYTPGRNLDLSPFANGMYVIQLLHNGQVNCTLKVIKKKD